MIYFQLLELSLVVVMVVMVVVCVRACVRVCYIKTAASLRSGNNAPQSVLRVPRSSAFRPSTVAPISDILKVWGLHEYEQEA